MDVDGIKISRFSSRRRKLGNKVQIYVDVDVIIANVKNPSE